MDAHSQRDQSDSEARARGEDYDLAASYLAARATQTRVLWICSILGVAGLVILAVCLTHADARLTPSALPGVSSSVAQS